MKKKLYFNWSSGKDSALALYIIITADFFKVDLLLTSISKNLQRVSMHGLHKDLLLAQAKAIDLPLEIIEIPESSSMEAYNQVMQEKMQSLFDRNYKHTAFGDIFLEDLKKYREEQLAKVGVLAHFPLWKRNTKQLMKEFLTLGFKTIVVCANSKWFSEKDLGITIDQNWLNSLPDEVDSCGENGEFHTFCYDGPIFKNPVEFELGEIVKKSYPNPQEINKMHHFWFIDLELIEN